MDFNALISWGLANPMIVLTIIIVIAFTIALTGVVRSVDSALSRKWGRPPGTLILEGFYPEVASILGGIIGLGIQYVSQIPNAWMWGMAAAFIFNSYKEKAKSGVFDWIWIKLGLKSAHPIPDYEVLQGKSDGR